eukprot:scaffold136001_cov31-Tisochrysis_lutea.AAC.2
MDPVKKLSSAISSGPGPAPSPCSTMSPANDRATLPSHVYRQAVPASIARPRGKSERDPGDSKKRSLERRHRQPLRAQEGIRHGLSEWREHDIDCALHSAVKRADDAVPNEALVVHGR